MIQIIDLVGAAENEAVPKKPKQSYTVRGIVHSLSPQEIRTSSLALYGDRGYVTSVPLRVDGSFSLMEVPTGAYMLSINSADAFFDRLKVICSKGNIAISSESNTSATYSHPISIYPASRAVFEMRSSFDWRSLLSNPMVIMSGIAVLGFLSSKITGSNQEMLADLSEEDRAQVPQFMQALLVTPKAKSENAGSHFSQLVQRRHARRREQEAAQSEKDSKRLDKLD